MAPDDLSFRDMMASLEGMISFEEALFLRQAAAAADGGCIVEIGSWRGKSAVAMALGVATRPQDERPRLYCIEPHRPFVGIYGGHFGPPDRKAFFETMLATGCAELVALVNLPSEQAAAGWREPIAFLFIDGDHSYDAVRRDTELWLPFLAHCGVVAFDDALDNSGGPYRVLNELTAGGGFTHCYAVGKIVAIRKDRPYRSNDGVE